MVNWSILMDDVFTGIRNLTLSPIVARPVASYMHCYQCHNNTENHAFGRYNQRSNQLIVMCGVCGHQMTYARYDEINQCDQCETPFNPGCSLHKHLYVC